MLQSHSLLVLLVSTQVLLASCTVYVSFKFYDYYYYFKVVYVCTLLLVEQVYCTPVRAAVHDSGRSATPAGFDQRDSGSSAV